MEFEKESPMMEVLKAVHGLYHWGGQSISVNSLVAKKYLITTIVKECEVGQERQRELE